MKPENVERPIRWTPSVQYRETDDTLFLLDQTLLPGQTLHRAYQDPEACATAIQTMVVRGADAIGITAGYAMVLAARRAERSASPLEDLLGAAQRLRDARPTAVHLRWAVDRVLRVLEPQLARHERLTGSLRDVALLEARAIEAEDRAMCRQIGIHGAAVLDSLKATAVLTHCNAGRLATADYGTATAPIYVLQEQGRTLTVYCDETRPLLQGARLTTWELTEAGIPAIQIVDSAAATVLAQGKVQAVLTGADRIAANGDTANKIGTFPLALAAKALGVPFYVAAPASTFDRNCPNGAAIPVEERRPEEVSTILGQVSIAPARAQAWNPAFDITPQDLISGFITDRGLLSAPYDSAILSAFAG